MIIPSQQKTIELIPDTYLDITDKIEEDELQKFVSYTLKKSELDRNRHNRFSPFIKNVLYQRLKRIIQLNLPSRT